MTKSLFDLTFIDKAREDNNDARERQLDIQILYLRRVHGFCYYCIEEYEDERMLTSRCDNIHLRSNKCLGSRINISTIEPYNTAEVAWDQKFNDSVLKFINKFSGILAEGSKTDRVS